MNKRHCTGVSSWLLVCLLCGLAIGVGTVQAQMVAGIRLQIRLRDHNGAPVVGETVTLQRLPEEAAVPPTCTSDADGRCSWIVHRGLYQLLFERPLDGVSALAVAEAGLGGLGITVGEAPITYHFTFHRDGRVYFDAAPEAAVPQPIIPMMDVLLGGSGTAVEPTATEGVAVIEWVEKTPAPEPPPPPATTPGKPWRLLLFIGGGLVIGGSWHWWCRRRSQANGHQPRSVKDGRSAEEESDA